MTPPQSPAAARSDQFTVKWVDRGEEPRCPSNPEWPHGKDIDATKGSERSACAVALPYPAARCGVYLVTCNACGVKIAVTTAGRADDPRSLKMLCRTRLN